MPGRRVDRLLQVQPADAGARSRNSSCHWSCWSPPGVPRPAPARRRAAPASARAWCAGGARARARSAAPPPARTSAAGCRGGSRARGWSASSAASRRWASPRSCCPSGRRRRCGRCRRGSRPVRTAPSARPTPAAGVRPPARRRVEHVRRGSRGVAAAGATRAAARRRRASPIRAAPLGDVRRGEQRRRRARRRRRRTRPRGRRRRACSASTDGVHAVGASTGRARQSGSRSSMRELLQQRRALAPGPVLRPSQPSPVERRPAPRRSPRTPARSSPVSSAGVAARRWSPGTAGRLNASTASATKPCRQARRAASICASRSAPGRLGLGDQPPLGGGVAPGCGTARPAPAAARRAATARPRSSSLARTAPAPPPTVAPTRGQQRVPVLGVADRRTRARRAAASVPWSRSSSSQASTAPGTAAASGPEPGTRSRPSAAVVLDGRAGRRRALPAEHASASGPPAVAKMAGTSPPGPLRCGSTTCRTNPAATAASKALPPRSSTAIADWRGQPVRGGDHAEGALERGAGGERHDSTSWICGATRGRCRRRRPGGRRPARRRRSAAAPAPPAAPVDRDRAPGPEPAAGRRVERARQVAAEHDRRRAALPHRVGHRRRGQQRLRVRVARARAKSSLASATSTSWPRYITATRRPGTPPRPGRG